MMEGLNGDYRIVIQKQIPINYLAELKTGYMGE